MCTNVVITIGVFLINPIAMTLLMIFAAFYFTQNCLTSCCRQRPKGLFLQSLIFFLGSAPLGILLLPISVGLLAPVCIVGLYGMVLAFLVRLLYYSCRCCCCAHRTSAVFAALDTNL
jgi:hypothetical protein